VCRSQAYRGFESRPLYEAFQRELGGFFIWGYYAYLIQWVSENGKEWECTGYQFKHLPYLLSIN
jgi:hypothetical protein